MLERLDKTGLLTFDYFSNMYGEDDNFEPVFKGYSANDSRYPLTHSLGLESKNTKIECIFGFDKYCSEKMLKTKSPLWSAYKWVSLKSLEAKKADSISFDLLSCGWSVKPHRDSEYKEKYILSAIVDSQNPNQSMTFHIGEEEIEVVLGSVFMFKPEITHAVSFGLQEAILDDTKARGRIIMEQVVFPKDLIENDRDLEDLAKSIGKM